MPTRAVLFDLDETLVRDGDATHDALRATALFAARKGVNTDELARAAWERACAEWDVSPFQPYFEEMGVSPGECLWGRFIGEDPRLRPMGAWAAHYQLDCWMHALARQGVTDEMLGATLAERFRVERRARHDWLFPETRDTLETLAPRYTLGLVTNGAPDIQRDKLIGSGLEGYFPTVQISAEARSGKPDPTLILRALEALSVAPGDAVMVGDNAARDVLAANRAGVRAIWIRRGREPSFPGARVDATIASLADLAPLL
ncbi:MAG TPA: HAD family hydrolase [Ktedonobacterales bacterium]